jgi:hypothetical protein
MGIWVPTQHLLWDQGKPRKTLIKLAQACRLARLTTAQQRTTGQNLLSGLYSKLVQGLRYLFMNV